MITKLSILTLSTMKIKAFITYLVILFLLISYSTFAQSKAETENWLRNTGNEILKKSKQLTATNRVLTGEIPSISIEEKFLIVSQKVYTNIPSSGKTPETYYRWIKHKINLSQINEVKTVKSEGNYIILVKTNPNDIEVLIEEYEYEVFNERISESTDVYWFPKFLTYETKEDLERITKAIIHLAELNGAEIVEDNPDTF